MVDLGTRLDLIEAGLGWGSMPRQLVCERLAAGTLVALRSEAYPRGEFRVPLFVLHRGGDPLGPAGRWLLDTLERVCGDTDAIVP